MAAESSWAMMCQRRERHLEKWRACAFAKVIRLLAPARGDVIPRHHRKAIVRRRPSMLARVSLPAERRYIRIMRKR